ncbi:fatty acyl-AMP ligase [uncultured Sphingomonas sp.]|uniref:fatty acyl-AMP ligase n=1 Tax=uncultured Sphingomonas sp. TaxID=158754 RepID=UPI0035CBB789
MRFVPVVDVILANAERWPCRASLIQDEGTGPVQQLTYAELAIAVKAGGAAIRARGWSGQRVGLLFSPGIEVAVAMLACLAADAVAVPIAPTGRRRERLANVVAILRDCAPAVVLHDAVMGRQYGSELDAAAAACDVALWDWRDLEMTETDAVSTPAAPGDLAILQYTSGSTSRPKGVMITHGNISANQQMIRTAFGHDENSSFVGWAPHFHDQGLFGNILQPLFLGTTAVLASPAAFIQRPLMWIELVGRYGAHTSGGPDFAYALCVEHAERRGLPAVDLSGWRVAFNGAEPIRETTMARFSACFGAIGFRPESFLPCYGLAECTLLATGRRSSLPPILRTVETDATTELDGVKAVCCGPATDHCDVRIVDAGTGVAQPDGEAGEIWLAGPHVAAGYWGQPADETFMATLATGEGPFLRTGDIGTVTPEGLYVIGRAKDLIIVRGRNFAPSDVEQVWEQLADRAGPAPSAAVQVEHDGRSHVVLVAEIDRAGRQDDSAPGDEVERWAAALRQAALHRLDLSVSDLILVPPAAIPRTTSGKIRRAAVRQAITEGAVPIVAAAGPLAGRLMAAAAAQ